MIIIKLLNGDSYVLFRDGYYCELSKYDGYDMLRLIEKEMRLYLITNVTVNLNSFMDFLINNGYCKYIWKDKKEQIESRFGSVYMVEKPEGTNENSKFRVWYKNTKIEAINGETLVITENGIGYPELVSFYKVEDYRAPSIKFSATNIIC